MSTFLILLVSTLTMTAADIILIIVGTLITLGLGIIISNQSKQGLKLDKLEIANAQTATLLQSLPIQTIEADIRSNRHKIQDVDKILVDLLARINTLERRHDHQS